MSCWRGVCRVCRGRSLTSTGLPAEAQSSRVKTFDAAPPSASYTLMDQIERQEAAAEMMPRRQPQGCDLQDLKEDMEKFRKHMEKAQQDAEEAKRPKSGPREAPGRFDLVTVEDGSGHRKPQLGGTVKLRYAVVLERDATLLDAKHDFEYVVGSESQGTGEVCSKLLDGMLLQMRRGQVASVTHPLKDLFPSNAPVLARGPEEVGVCEVSLLEIYVTKDCSFKNSTGQVIKEVIKDGVGPWCNNPSDEGMAVLRIEKITTSEGRCLFPEAGASPTEMCVNVGDGQVCDALECAVVEMRPHETALVTCRDPSFLVGGFPLGEKPVPKSSEYTLRVTLLDFNPGPDALSFDEDDRLTFALRRKAEANRLFKEGRFRLSRQRYVEICELFHHLDIPKVKDRFLGKYDLWQECRKLRLDCRLNIAACSIKLQDSSVAKEACDLVLKQMPENTKALYRRAQAQMQQREYVEACKDLRRLLDIDPNIQEARRLWEKAVKQRKDVDEKQKKIVTYDKMCRRIVDDRTNKFTYDNAALDYDDDEDVEGRPVSEWLKFGKEQLRR